MRRLIATAAGLVLVAAACSGGGANPGVSGPPRTVDLDGDVTLAAALRPFDGCDALLEHLRREGAMRVGPYGLEGEQPIYALEESADLAQRSSADDTGAETASPASGGSDRAAFSGTNVQEEGIDEPDLVKTDGERLVTVVDGTLRVIGVTGEVPTELGSLPLPEAGGHELFLHGNTVVVLSSGWAHSSPVSDEGGAADSSMPAGQQTAIVSEVDIAAPAEMEVRSTLRIDGAHLSARQVGSTVRVVVRSAPSGLGFVHPQDGSDESLARAEEVNRQVVEESTLDQWLPAATLDDEEQDLVACDQVHTPTEFAGFGALSVVTLDLDEGLATVAPDDTVSVLAGGETVYASTDGLYVATTRWAEPEPDEPGSPGGPDAPRSLPHPRSLPATTELHRFATTGDGPARYEGSGSVRGQLLNQFSLSEHDGHLRVATTEGDQWGGADQPSESFVTTLAVGGDELAQVGQVGGLGKGERIYAVRFLGDVGYVVTFRQVDPLYTVDLSDPADPRVTGELKIEGYSAYLHPVGDDLLVGVGQDATLEGRTTGTQVSLFDVSDPAAPERLHHHAVADGSSEAEYDHHAFLWWAPAQLAVLPIEGWSFDEASREESHRSGAVGLTIDAEEGIAERGTVTHPRADQQGWVPSIRRSVVVGDTLYTLSERGIGAADLATFAETGWLAFER